MGEFDVVGADGFAGVHRAAQDRQAGGGEKTALDLHALRAGVGPTRDDRCGEAVGVAVDADLLHVDLGGRFERQVDRDRAAAEIDLVAVAHAFGLQRFAQGRQDVVLVERAARTFQHHAVEAGLRAPGDTVGAGDVDELRDFDRYAPARGGAAQHGAIRSHAVEQIGEAHDIAFDRDHIGAQRLRRGGGGGRDDRRGEEGEEQDEGFHGDISGDPMVQRIWLTTLSIWSEAWMTFEFIS